MSEAGRSGSAADEQILVLQGGGALGAYQAGAYEALVAHDHQPDWIAGISIGAINAALIAGNRPQDRVDRLRTFWETITTGPPEALDGLPAAGPIRAMANDLSAAQALLCGQPGFFRPRWPMALPWAEVPTGELSYYDTGPLRRTLEQLVDFDRINDGPIRLSVGAVNIRTGNFRYFDSRHVRLDVRHILASGALPPAFAPVEIDGEFYWDGGLVSNTPLEYVLDQPAQRPRLLVQLDLYPASGRLPTRMDQVAERVREIRFSSRTRLGTDAWVQRQRYAEALRALLARLPADAAGSPEARLLADAACPLPVTILHLIYRPENPEGQAKDHEFSRRSQRDHWGQGRADVQRAFADRRWAERRTEVSGVRVFDLTAERAGPAGRPGQLPV